MDGEDPTMDATNIVINGEQITTRLHRGLKANKATGMKVKAKQGSMGSMKASMKDLRIKFPGFDDSYVWNAMCGAEGGVTRVK